MGLDIYLSKKTFIGTMFNSREVTGVIELFSRGRKLPIELKRVSYITEDIYHGRKTWWLLEWLEHELKDTPIENAAEYPIEADVIDRLHQTCNEVLKCKEPSNLRKACKEKLYYYLKDDMDDDDFADFVYDLEKLRDATKRTETDSDVKFTVTASW